jgi:hypothetical protein
MRHQDHIAATQYELRQVRDELALVRRNYARLADLVADAAVDLRAGRPLSPDVIAGLRDYEWQER